MIRRIAVDTPLRNCTTKGGAMRLPLALASASIALALSASPLAAQCCCPIIIPQAPNTYGPCYYVVNEYGQLYGPNYCLRPCYPPFQGMVPGPKPPAPKGKPQFGPPMPGAPPGQGPGFAPAMPGPPPG